jgi:enoyl-CoA hydratase/carnithine racemase
MNKIRFETTGSLGILTLANPPLNLFSEELINDLCSTVTEVQHAPVRALLVHAEGKIFSGGADVSVFRGRTASEARERSTSQVQLIADLEELPFPTLAVFGLMNAAAVAGGAWFGSIDLPRMPTARLHSPRNAECRRRNEDGKPDLSVSRN